MGRRSKKGRSAPVGPVVAEVEVADQSGEDSPCNQVVLVGRLAAPAEERTMPSGAVLVVWRVVVDRPPQDAPVPGVRPVTVDTLDCAGWTTAVQDAVHSADVGDVLRVVGALRRRFWRGATGLASRYEVEATSIEVVRRAAPGVPQESPAEQLRRPGGPAAPAPSAASA